MPATTTPANEDEPLSRRNKPHVPARKARDDSDDELGSDDLPWEWIYDTESVAERTNDDADGEGDRKRRRITASKIVGAKMGSFECRVGDCVLLKAEGSNEAWVGIICEFIDDDGQGDKAANFMWFSTEKEIRNRDKKRTDFYSVGPLPSHPKLAGPS
jgi:origin recognition complex subunit 1